MKITLIYNPNRKGASHEVRVHRAGCRDIDRDSRLATSVLTTAAFTKQEAAADWWADFIEERSMGSAQAREYTEFLPCTRELPEDERPRPEHTCVAGPTCRQQDAANADDWRFKANHRYDANADDGRPCCFLPADTHPPAECRHWSCLAVDHEPCETCFTETMETVGTTR